MTENFDVIVQVKDDLRKSLIFGINSRLAIATILGLSGHHHEIMPLV